MAGLREALRDLPDAVYADLLESEEGYLLVLDLPGTTAETVDLRVEGGRLSVEARRRKETPAGFAYLEENRTLFLDAELPLPPDATGADAGATVERGVLELRLPKREAASSREIPVEDA